MKCKYVKWGFALLIWIFIAAACNQHLTSTKTSISKKNTHVSARNSIAAAWVTNPDKSLLFSKQSPDLAFTNSSASLPTINIDNNQTYQVMDGFGNTLTGGSAQLLCKMDAPVRASILKELFDTTGNNIGVSYLRISIGASDLDDYVFSYNDLPAGQTITAPLQKVQRARMYGMNDSPVQSRRPDQFIRPGFKPGNYNAAFIYERHRPGAYNKAVNPVSQKAPIF